MNLVEKPKLAKQDILQRLQEKLEALILADAASIRPDIWLVPRREPSKPNWDFSFTGLSTSERRIVEAAAELLRCQIDLA